MDQNELARMVQRLVGPSIKTHMELVAALQPALRQAEAVHRAAAATFQPALAQHAALMAQVTASIRPLMRNAERVTHIAFTNLPTKTAMQRFDISPVFSAPRRSPEQIKAAEDRAMGWEFEETKMLRIAWDGYTTKLLRAEIHREDIFGFTPNPFRHDVRFRLHPDEFSHTDPLAPPPLMHITLYQEDGKPFGRKCSFRWKKCYERKSGVWDYFLCDYGPLPRLDR